MFFLGAAATEGAVLCNTQALVTKGAGGRGEEIPRGPVMHVDRAGRGVRFTSHT